MLVTVFKRQVCAAAVGEMPIFSGVFPGVQNFTRISTYCISAFFLTFVGFTGEEGGISDLLEVGTPFLEAAGLLCVMEKAVGGSLLRKSSKKRYAVELPVLHQMQREVAVCLWGQC